MSIGTDWLLAAEAEAPAVASIAGAEDHSFEDWPHAHLDGIGLIELDDLATLARADKLPHALGPLLFQDSEEGPFVAAVDPTFTASLAAIADGAVPAVATSWQQSEHLRGWPPEDVAQALRQIVAFARRSVSTQTPILQLMTL